MRKWLLRAILLSLVVASAWFVWRACRADDDSVPQTARAEEIDGRLVKSIAETAERTSNIMTVLLVSIAAISLLAGGIGIMRTSCW